MEWKDNVMGLQHIGIPTNDMTKSVSFYRGIGFELVYQTVIEATNEKVTFMQCKDFMLEIYENGKAVGAAGAIDHIALNVKDAEDAYDRAKAEGYKILTDGIEFLPFWKNGVKFFTIQGPNGESVEFNQYL